MSCDMGMVILFVYDSNHLQHNVQAVGEYIMTTVVACLTSSI
jgi:4-aminobutyrate aminotransferase-like enzyme